MALQLFHHNPGMFGVLYQSLGRHNDQRPGYWGAPDAAPTFFTADVATSSYLHLG